MLVFPVLLACTGHNGRPDLNGAEEEVKDQQSVNLAVIAFDSLEHDFGTIIEGEKVVCYFDYENTGRSDLVVSSVEVSCGCTTPDWSSEPLKPGGRRSLQIIFDATGRSGIQRKTVTVKSNASNSVVQIILRANIET